MSDPLNISPQERFRSHFVGRDYVMRQLQMLHARASKGDPQFVVLLGPSGIGKTRIVQELYRELTRQQDPASPEFPQGYWPDAFGDGASLADVNPFFADPNRPRTAIPWLWWGLKFAEPPRQGRRTDEGEALLRGLPALKKHLVAATAKRHYRSLK